MKKVMFTLIILFLTDILAKETIIVYSKDKVTSRIMEKLDNLSIDYNFELKVVPKNRLEYILKPWKENNCKNYVRRCYPNWIVLNNEPFLDENLEKNKFLFKQLAFNENIESKKASNEHKKYIMTNKNNEKIFWLLNTLDSKE